MGKGYDGTVGEGKKKKKTSSLWSYSLLTSKTANLLSRWGFTALNKMCHTDVVTGGINRDEVTKKSFQSKSSPQHGFSHPGLHCSITKHAGLFGEKI